MASNELGQPLAGERSGRWNHGRERDRRDGDRSHSVSKIEEIDKRLGDRFAELAKRLAEIDKRIDLKTEFAVRSEFDRRTAEAQKPDK